MRSSLIVGLYLLPVAAFAAFASVSGYAEQMVEYSEIQDSSIFAEMFNSEDKKELQVATAAVAPTAKTDAADATESKAKQGFTWLLAGNGKPLRLDDLSLKAVVAEFDAMLNQAGTGNGQLIAKASQTGVPAASFATAFTDAKENITAALDDSAGLSTLAARSATAASGALFGGSSGVSASVRSGLSTFNSPANTPSAAPFGTATQTTATSGAQPATTAAASLTAVPLPAGAPLLLVGLAGLGLMRRRQTR